MENFEYLEALMGRIKDWFAEVAKAERMADISALERKGVEFIRELQLASPRAWEDVMRAAQKRRSELSKGQ